ncbi:MAG: adenylate/guanylate cyclase domain-containing protein [Candidatus Dormibacteria bacterium]
MVEPSLALDRERLAELSGFSAEQVAECEAAGLIEAEDGVYKAIELLKLQLIGQVAQQVGGLPLVIDRYLSAGFPLGFLELCLPSGQDLSAVSYRDLMKRLGIPEEEAQAVLRAAGLPMPNLEAPARLDEVSAFESYAAIRALPIPIDARLHAMRVTGESMRRVTEVQAQLFHTHVVEPLLDAYREDLGRANEVIGEISGRANETVSSLTSWLYQRYLEHQIVKSVTERMEAAVSTGSPSLGRPRDPSVAFVDLVGFTVLSAAGGDHEAADLAQHFTDQLIEITATYGGRVIKTLGDGAMLFFDHGTEAVRACLQLQRDLETQGFPPIRVGINRGPIVAQAGDFYGTTINVAARITDYARPREVLVASSVVPDGADGIELEEIGEVTLRGVALPVHLCRAREAAAAR